MMKHPDRVKAETYEREAAKTRETAAAYRKLAGVSRGSGVRSLADGYEAAAAGLDTLAAALQGRSEYFAESARSEKG